MTASPNHHRSAAGRPSGSSRTAEGKSSNAHPTHGEAAGEDAAVGPRGDARSAESAWSREVITIRSVTDPEGGAGMDPDEEAAVAIGRAAERTLLVFVNGNLDAKDDPTRVDEARKSRVDARRNRTRARRTPPVHEQTKRRVHRSTRRAAPSHRPRDREHRRHVHTKTTPRVVRLSVGASAPV